MKDIHKFYGSNHALKGVDFEVKPKEVVGLVGDNGAGKSTLIKILTGVTSKSRGRIYWKGKEVNISSVEDARRLKIETVYQDQAVIGSMSVAQNIFLGRPPTNSIGPLKILDKKKMREKAREITGDLGLDISSADQEVRFCSGGEKQGVAISRAMNFEAELVILDEPTTALSVRGSRKVLDFVKQLKDEGVACIYISHNLHHVYPVSDRFVVLARGEKIEDIEKDRTSIEELEDLQVMDEKAEVDNDATR